MWEQLTKKGYEITNKRILGNPAYTSEQTRHKDLVQELALVQDWFIKQHDLLIGVDFDNKKYFWFINYLDEKDKIIQGDFDNYTLYPECLISAIEYTINNLI